jgi:hypothetical protein
MPRVLAAFFWRRNFAARPYIPATVSLRLSSPDGQASLPQHDEVPTFPLSADDSYSSVEPAQLLTAWNQQQVIPCRWFIQQCGASAAAHSLKFTTGLPLPEHSSNKITNQLTLRKLYLIQELKITKIVPKLVLELLETDGHGDQIRWPRDSLLPTKVSINFADKRQPLSIVGF